MHASNLTRLGFFLMLAGCAPTRHFDPKRPPASPVELYVTHHSEIYLEKDSPAWKQLSAEERAAHEEEGGVFQEVDDELLLQPRGPDQLAFCVHHYGRFLHECQYSGIATRTGPNVFTYRETYTNYSDELVECAVQLAREQTRIVFDELEPAATPGLRVDCRMYCGVHASLGDGMEFALTDRQTDPDIVTEAQDASHGCPLPR